MKRKATLWVLGALALLPFVQSANATMVEGSPSNSLSVLYSQSVMVQGSDASTTTLVVPSAGEIFLTLTDLNFPNPFSSLKFALTNSTTALVGLANAGTVLTLDLTGPTTLYAEVFATAGGPSNQGLYNLTATFMSSAAAVPLPASGFLLGSVALLALLFRGPLRRSAKKAEERALVA